MAGFSLLELITAIVIIGLGLAGLVTTYAVVARHSADPLIQKQMLAVAEEMMEEILLKPYAPASNATAATCGRDTWNDLMDYNGYDTRTRTCVSGGAAGTAMIYDIAGNGISNLAGYSVSVTIVDSSLSSTVPAKKITVTVRHGTDSLQLVSWRSNYAG